MTGHCRESEGNNVAGEGEKMMEIAVYGAGMVATSVYHAIKTLYPDCEITSFVVSEREGNPVEINGIPVLSLDEFCNSEKRPDITILVAAPENHHDTITKELFRKRLKNYICMDSAREATLMQYYYKKTGRFLILLSCGRKREKKGNISLHVYMAKSCWDMPLKKPWKQPKWLCQIQAGAALTEWHIADIRDNVGDNISEKNGNYSELTALYWIWKNRGNQGQEHDYFGLFHYRRILDIAEEDVCRIGENEVDVILPYPTVCFPSIHEHHKRYVKSNDWMAMVSALEELEPEYAKSMSKIFSGSYFYNYNILVARKEIFNEFCAWLFPILRRTEELSIPKGWERADRYIGYLGESLTTLYFMYHEHDFKIAHTGRLLLT